MLISVRWLNAYLTSPSAGTPVTADEAEAILMAQGLPSESRTDVVTCEGKDVCLDVEVTSNRGDCLSHLGIAREVAAHASGKWRLSAPVHDPAPRIGESVEAVLGLENQIPDVCPLFVAWVIRGVRVSESPGWLRARLEGAGQRPINNVVDVTNFIALELGNPCHVFDLATLAGRKIVVRMAREAEALMTLDGKKRILRADEMVVADGERAQGLAGVMGGGDSEVSASTTDVVLEMATWDPVAVRRAARRHQLRTTASHRYERIVDARTLDAAAERAAALICDVAGGKACTGVLRAGRPLVEPPTIRFRPARCTSLLGYELPVQTMVRHMHAVGVESGPLGRAGEELICTPPAHRPDLTREVDLIEEVARIQGLDSVPVHSSIGVRPSRASGASLARREIASILTGLGFFETVTFSFAKPQDAKAFIPQGMSVIEMNDERRGGEGALRPSVLTGLLGCRRQNQHGNVRQAGGVRLYEVASVYAQAEGDRSVENVNIGMLMDVAGKGRTDEVQEAIRAMRGAVESIVSATAGPDADLRFEPAPPHCPAFENGAFARITLKGAPLGYFGLVTKATQAAFDLDTRVVGCEVSLAALVDVYPPASRVVLPPAFPGIERDYSLVVAESVRWDTIRTAVVKRQVPPLEGVTFVGAFRDEKKLGKDKKSVTLRLAFRDPDRTLRNDEIDAPAAALLKSLKEDFAFELRV